MWIIALMNEYIGTTRVELFLCFHHSGNSAYEFRVSNSVYESHA